MGRDGFSLQKLINSGIQRFFSQLVFLHLPIRAFSKQNTIVERLFATNTLYFTKAASAKKIKADTIGIGFN